ncbi:MAG: SPOR domain-containing protein [Nitrospirae bacterium]|nr:SPOR domain-containing protein [Nitrospirota bacterium]
MVGETILIIDTDTKTTQEMVSILEAEDYLVFTAPNGDIGITMAKKVNPLLIFVNPAMAGTSGLEICKTIHSMEQFKNVPIIVLSAFEGAMDSRYTSIYGIVDSLKKPFGLEELIRKTKAVLAGKPFESQPVEQAEEYMDFGVSEETMPVEEETLSLNKGFDEEIDFSDRTEVKPTEDIDFSDKTEVMSKKEDFDFSEETETKQRFGSIAEEKTEYMETPVSRPEEAKVASERTYVLKKSARRRGAKNGLLIPIVAAAGIVIMLGTAGFLLYKKGSLPWIGTKPQKQIAAKPATPLEQVAQIPPSGEQKPEPPAAESKPVPSATPPQVPISSPEVKPTAKTTTAPQPATAPVPRSEIKSAAAVSSVPVAKSAVKTEVKPTAKGGYSVQIGAFKNENNAAALAKQYKDKGYDAFVQKWQKNKETLYRVLVGKFENNREAVKLAANIRDKEKTKAIIFKE